jgi:hypothetical protein
MTNINMILFIAKNTKIHKYYLKLYNNEYFIISFLRFKTTTPTKTMNRHIITTQ